MIRLNNKIFLFTYSRSDQDLNEILESLRAKFLEYGRTITKYIVAHEEHKDGFPHRHAYIELDSALRTAVPATAFDLKVHPNVLFVKSPARAAKYCKKKGEYITNIDDLNVKVTKADLGRMLIKDDIDLDELVVTYPQLIFGYGRLKADIREFKSKQHKVHNIEDVCGYLIHGRAGTWKTRAIDERFPGAYYKNNTKYWDGYAGEPVVVLDDVDKSWGPVVDLFKWWADYKSYPIEFKGEKTEKIARPQMLIASSNFSLEELWDLWGRKDDIAPFLRRFTQCYTLGKDDSQGYVAGWKMIPYV